MERERERGSVKEREGERTKNSGNARGQERGSWRERNS